MAPRTTRSKAKGTIVKTEAETIAGTSSLSQKKPLQPESKNPPKLFILPKDTSSSARIITLADSRTSKPTRYFVCPEKGFYEFTKVAAPNSTPRSWLLTPSDDVPTETSRSDGPEKLPTKDNGNEFTATKGYISSSADLFLATPIDPLFLLLPALAGNRPTKAQESKRLFQEADDYFDVLSATSTHFKLLLDHAFLRNSLMARMAAVCDTVDAGDETMYRLSESKLLGVLAHKCTAMVKKGLPASMEEKLVRKALEIPLLSVKRGENSEDHELADEEDTVVPKIEGAESQTTVSATESFTTSASEASTAVTTPLPGPSPPLIVAPEGVPDLLRLRTAFAFLCTSYIHPLICASITSKIRTHAPDSPSGFPDFEPLDKHLAHLALLRAEALASRSLSDFSRKRNLNEDEESGETRAEKKRKLEEEEKMKKKNESRGVRDLKKVDTSGMKKMSDFFKKKA